MFTKLFTTCFTLFIILMILSCSDKNPVNDDTDIDTVVEDTTTIQIPANVRIDSVAILDTVYSYEYHEISIDSISPTVFDTTIIITKIERDSILGSFVVHWDSVPPATRYFIYVHKSNGDLAWVLKTNTTRMFVGGLVPNNSYMIRIAATNESVVSKKSAYSGIEIYLPALPKNITADYFNKTAKVSWDPFVNNKIIGYRIFLLDINGAIVDSSDTLNPSTGSYSFPVGENSAYKINGITIDSIGTSLICSTYIYDITTGTDTLFKLPYVYLSTYEKPRPITGGYADSMVGVKGGIFAMGNIWGDTNMTSSSASQPVHEVVVSSFYLGPKEITHSQYFEFLNSCESIILVPGAIIEKDTLLLKDVVILKVDTVIYDSLNSLFDTLFVIDSIGTDSLGNPDTIYADTTITIMVDSTIPVDTLITLAWPDTSDTLIENSIYFFFSDSGDSLIVDTSRLHHPVSRVNWKGAVSYCNWLSKRDGLQSCYNSSDWSFDSSANGYRLPTEAEYEYVHSAAFLGTKQRYPWGYQPDPEKYCSDNTLEGPCVTGKYSRYFGFYDLSGNVMEWCNDWSDFSITIDSSYYEECLTNGICINPSGPLTGDYHILRGGSYQVDADKNSTAYRHVFPGTDVTGYGFRVARSEK